MSGADKLHALQQMGLDQAVFIPTRYGGKEPVFSEWQKKTLADMADPKYKARFDGQVSIGVLLGRPSANLCVIDIDDETAVESFLELNPILRETLRTRGARGCSLWIKIQADYPKPAKLKRARTATHIMEWRADGQQCIIQGKHPHGHDYQIINRAPPVALPFSEIRWPSELVKPWDHQLSPPVLLPASHRNGVTLNDGVLALARKYVQETTPAISGQGGHDRTFAVACALVKGFNLPIHDALPLMEEYSRRCIPRWNANEIDHKLSDADKAPDEKPRGYLLPPTSADLNDDLPIVRLPGNSIPIRESAKDIFTLIAPTHKIFNRGGGICELVQQSEGRLSLEVIRPSAFRSRVEQYASLEAERVGKNGATVFKPTIMPEETAKALLETIEARALLPTITGVVNCPVIRADVDGVKILGQGYDSETGLLVSGGQLPPQVPFEEAVTAIRSLVAEFDFPSEGDRSRAIASLLTPALKLGGFISGKVPADVAEADQSQAGKTYRQRIIAAVYNEMLSPVVQRAGGVGSIDESFAQQLVSGNPFIQIDNLRDKLDSQYLESFMTATGTFPARVPHSREIMVNPEWFFVYLTSNGVHTTRDFANRSSVIRIKKRARFQYRKYDEGDLFAHVRANQPYYLGCVFAVVREWVVRGKLKSDEARHDFREWVQILDWVVQTLFQAHPLMEGHSETQERISNPAMTLLRVLTLQVAQDHRLEESFTTIQLVDLCDNNGIEIPGLRVATPEASMKRIGMLLASVFKNTNSVLLDDYHVTRTETSKKRDDGEGYRSHKTYSFHRIPPVPQRSTTTTNVV